MDGKDPRGDESETLDLGQKNVAGDDEAKSSQEHPPQHPSSHPNSPRSSSSTGSVLIHHHAIEIPEDKVDCVAGKDLANISKIEQLSGAMLMLEAKPTSEYKRKLHIRGAIMEVFSAVRQLDDILTECRVPGHIPSFGEDAIDPSIWDEIGPSDSDSGDIPALLRSRLPKPVAKEKAQSSSSVHESTPKKSPRKGD